MDPRNIRQHFSVTFQRGEVGGRGGVYQNDARRGRPLTFRLGSERLSDPSGVDGVEPQEAALTHCSAYSAKWKGKCDLAMAGGRQYEVSRSNAWPPERDPPGGLAASLLIL